MGKPPRRYGIEIDTEEGPLYSEENLDAQISREEFWLKKTTDQFFGSGLIIYGFLHTFSSASHLKRAAFAVLVDKYLPFHKLCPR